MRKRLRKYLISIKGYKYLYKFSESTCLAWTVHPDCFSFSGGFLNTEYGNHTDGGVYISLFWFTLSIDWDIKKEGKSNG